VINAVNDYSYDSSTEIIKTILEQHPTFDRQSSPHFIKHSLSVTLTLSTTISHGSLFPFLRTGSRSAPEDQQDHTIFRLVSRAKQC
jgi:hypothetical protein